MALQPYITRDGSTVLLDPDAVRIRRVARALATQIEPLRALPGCGLRATTLETICDYLLARADEVQHLAEQQEAAAGGAP